MALWGERPERESPDTDLTEALPPSYVEPWNCEHCNKLMYNLDEKGRPAPGAPVPKASGEYRRLCSVCWEMKLTLDCRTYWIRLHNEWRELQKNDKKLKPGSDYFAS